MDRNRRWYAILGGTFTLVAAGIASAIVLTFSGTSEAAPTKSQYFARVAAICRLYGPKLDKIPPPVDISIPAEITTAVQKVLPVLKAEADDVRRLVPPRELREKLARWARLNDGSISKLDDALRAARQKDLRGIQVAYVEFVTRGAKAQRLRS